MLDSINPTTSELIKTYEAYKAHQVERSLELAHVCFLKWRFSHMQERAQLMRKAAEILLQQKDDLARLITLEMGKVFKQAQAEIEKCAWTCQYFADEGATFLADIEIKSDAIHSFVTFQPLGPILGVMPWNFPFWQVFRFAVPTIMAGNVCLIKHASNVSGCSLAIERVFIDAGFPSGCLQTLLLPSDRVTDLVKSPYIKAVSLTGSTNAGKAVAAVAGAHLKKTVLELGGSDPYIVLADADVDLAVSVCTKSRLNNAGQSCIAAKRFIVVQPFVDIFTQKLLESFQQMTVGDPFDAQTDIGPMARHDLRDMLHQQVTDTLSKGGDCILGGRLPHGPGAFYPPTILTKVQKGMKAYDEELFGPVAAIIEAKDENEAISIANDTPYGLGASIFTQDLQHGELLARTQLDAGSVFINEMVRSDPRLPFGGIKESGYGRELSSFGMREFVNIKTVLR